MGKRRHCHHDRSGTGPVSAATREDLDSAVADLAEAERLRARAAVALARVRGRGDGEAAVGMPVSQHLRWNTRIRRGTVTSLGVIADVAADLPTMTSLLADGTITIDQAAAIGWPASKAARHLRGELDRALDSGRFDGWTSLDPDSLQAEVERFLEELRPEQLEDLEDDRRQRQRLHLQPTLDGQGLAGWFQAWGTDAAFLDATLRQAADRPAADTERGGQLFGGLVRVCQAFAGLLGPTDEPDASNVTLYAIVDERPDAAGTGEFVATSAGLAPRISAHEVQRLRDAGARTIEVQTRDGEPVAITGRAGHVIDDPDGLSDDSIRILCLVRDRGCTMPGCDRPAEHLHHAIWRALAKARGDTSPDDPRHRAWLCNGCHIIVHTHNWSCAVHTRGPTPGATTWTRPSPIGRLRATTPGRLTRRLRHPPAQPDTDPDGHSLPF